MTNLDTHKNSLWDSEHKFFVDSWKVKYEADKLKIVPFLIILLELHTFWALKRKTARTTATLTYLIEYFDT